MRSQVGRKPRSGTDVAIAYEASAGERWRGKATEWWRCVEASSPDGQRQAARSNGFNAAIPDGMREKAGRHAQPSQATNAEGSHIFNNIKF